MEKTDVIFFFMVILIELILLAFVLLMLGVCVLIFLDFIRVGRGDVPFVPSATAVIHEVVQAGIFPKHGMILDLGCGDGKALRALARAGYTGPLIGYERAPLPWVLGRVLGWVFRLPVTVRHQDFSEAPLEQARGVYLFLFKEPLAALGPILARRLPIGTPVISAEFEISGWVPEQILMAKGITLDHAPIYIYRIPARG